MAGECSVVKDIEVVRGDIRDWERLGRYHYRGERLACHSGIWVLRHRKGTCKRSGAEAVGVIVYKMPSAGCAMRNVAMGQMFKGLDRGTQLQLVNRMVRCIGRVVIEPRYRGLGLASRLVRETLHLVGTPVVEAMGVMGWVNPFFERAGMKAYRGAEPLGAARLREAFSVVGIEEDELTDARRVQERIDGLSANERRFIEEQIQGLLESYGPRRRRMERGLGRTEFALSKLAARPVYYIWIKQKESGDRSQESE